MTYAGLRDVYKRQQFILRAAGGGEYVFRMDGAEDMVEGGVQAGQYVRIWYLSLIHI